MYVEKPFSKICTGEPVAVVISTFFSLFRWMFFSCRKLSISLATDVRCKQVHFSHAIFERVQLFTICLHSFAHCTWIHTLRAWLNFALHSKRVVPSLAPCLTPWYTEHAARLPHPFLLFLVLNHREGRSHPQHPAQIHGNHKRVAVILNYVLTHQDDGAQKTYHSGYHLRGTDYRFDWCSFYCFSN